MKYTQLATLKRNDLLLQIGIAITEFLIFYGGVGKVNEALAFFLVYLLAITQISSCIFWLFFSMKQQLPAARIFLQSVFLLPAIVLIISACISERYFFYLTAHIMIWLGPILGLWYFILTAWEVKYYRKLSKSGQP